ARRSRNASPYEARARRWRRPEYGCTLQVVPGGGPMQRLLDEIAELAQQSASRHVFRRETAARLRRAIGFDGVAWGPIPPGPPGTAHEYYGENIPAQSIVAIADDHQARLDIARAQQFLDAQVVAIDGGFTVSEKRRSAFFAGFL